MRIQKEYDIKNYASNRKSIPMIDKSFEYIRVKEYAKLTNQAIFTIYRYLNNGQIEGAIKSGRSWLIPVKKIGVQ